MLPHLYVEQSPLTVPAPLRGEIKRPDYLVGIPGVGLIAFDVKAKTIFADSLIFNLDEVRKLRTFARLFHMTVYFAYLDRPAARHATGCASTSSISSRLSRQRQAHAHFAGRKALPVSLDRDFYSAFVDAVALI